MRQQPHRTEGHKSPGSRLEHTTKTTLSVAFISFSAPDVISFIVSLFKSFWAVCDPGFTPVTSGVARFVGSCVSTFVVPREVSMFNCWFRHKTSQIVPVSLPFSLRARACRGNTDASNRWRIDNLYRRLRVALLADSWRHWPLPFGHAMPLLSQSSHTQVMDNRTNASGERTEAALGRRQSLSTPLSTPIECGSGL